MLKFAKRFLIGGVAASLVLLLNVALTSAKAQSSSEEPPLPWAPTPVPAKAPTPAPAKAQSPSAGQTSSGPIPFPWAPWASSAIGGAVWGQPGERGLYPHPSRAEGLLKETMDLAQSLNGLENNLRGHKNMMPEDEWVQNLRAVQNHASRLRRMRSAVIQEQLNWNRCYRNCSTNCPQGSNCQEDCTNKSCGEIRERLRKNVSDLRDERNNSKQFKNVLQVKIGVFGVRYFAAQQAGQNPPNSEAPPSGLPQQNAGLQRGQNNWREKKIIWDNCRTQCQTHCRNQARVNCRSHLNIGSRTGGSSSDCSSEDISRHCTYESCDQNQCRWAKSQYERALQESRAEGSSPTGNQATGSQELKGASKSPVEYASKAEKTIGIQNVAAAAGAALFGKQAIAYYNAKNYPLGAAFFGASLLATSQAIKLKRKKKKIKDLKLSLCEKDPTNPDKCVGEEDHPSINPADFPGCGGSPSCGELNEEIECLADPTAPNCPMPEYCENRPEDSACSNGDGETEIADCHNNPDSPPCQTWQEHCRANPTSAGCAIASPQDVLCRVLTPQADCNKKNIFTPSDTPPQLTEEQKKELDKYTQDLNTRQQDFLNEMGLGAFSPEMTAVASPSASTADKKAEALARAPGAATTAGFAGLDSSPVLDDVLGLDTEDDTGDGRLNRQTKNRMARYYTPGGGAPHADPFAGKSVDFNGEVIGVAQDNIFLMVHRRYQDLSHSDRFFEGDDGGR